MLIVTMVTTMKKLEVSLVAADNALATSRVMTSGLRKRARNCSQGGEGLTVAASLGPWVVNRDWISAVPRPAGVVASRARSRSKGRLQISSRPSSSLAVSAATSRWDPLTCPRSRGASIGRSSLTHCPTADKRFIIKQYRARSLAKKRLPSVVQPAATPSGELAIDGLLRQEQVARAESAVVVLLPFAE